MEAKTNGQNGELNVSLTRFSVCWVLLAPVADCEVCAENLGLDCHAMLRPAEELDPRSSGALRQSLGQRVAQHLDALLVAGADKAIGFDQHMHELV